MIISDLFQETISALSGNKARSGLTILGIVIGIGSVIAMISIGQGAQGSIQSSIESIGSNLILVRPGFQRTIGAQVRTGRGEAQTLTQADADAITKDVTQALLVAPEVDGRYQVTASGKNTNTQIVGTVGNYAQVRNTNIAEGSFISEQNVLSTSKVAVLGPSTRDDLFGLDASAVGQNIRIKGVMFKVIGITQSKGSSGFMNQDDIIYVPITTAQRFLSGSDYVSSISVQADNADSMSAVQAQINELLLQRHKISDPTQADFQVQNQSDILATASSITNTFTILLASIAGISLLVGGIGIMNMMLTTVTERTREIGLRKAIGAKKKDITMQFLTEAIMLTFIGGIIGIGLGWLLSKLIAQFGDMQTTISLGAIMLAFGVSATIGLVFGYYPAKRAAKLNPIEALRYE